MKSIIVLISLLTIIITPCFGKNIYKQATKYKKRGVHLPLETYSPAIIKDAKDFFKYKKGLKIISKKRVKALRSNDSQLITLTNNIIDPTKQWNLYHYTISRNAKNKAGNDVQSKIKFYFYESLVEFPLSVKNKRPLLLMTPTIRGIKNGIYVNIEPKWAEHFASQGYHVLLIQLGDTFLNLNRPFASLDTWVRNKIVDQRALVDFAHTYLANKIDTNKIIAYGSSLGGIRTIITMALEKTRIALGVTVVAGGNFADLVVTTNQKEVVEYRDHRMTIEGFNENFPLIDTYSKKEQKYFQTKLKKHYKSLNPSKPEDFNRVKNLEKLYGYIKTVTKTEPLFFAKERNFSDDLLMYISLKDSKVRSKTQLELWEALGHPSYHLNGKIFRNHGPFILDVARNRLTEAQAWIEKRLFEKGLINSKRDL